MKKAFPKPLGSLTTKIDLAVVISWILSREFYNSKCQHFKLVSSINVKCHKYWDQHFSKLEYDAISFGSKFFLNLLLFSFS